MAKRFSQEEIGFIKNNYSKLGRKTCSEILNISDARVLGMARKFGLLVSKDRVRFIHSNIVRKPESLCVNPLGFIEVWTPEHAYLMGFIWGDGYLGDFHYRTVIQIGEIDATELSATFNKTGKWTKTFQKKEKEHYQNRITFLTNNKTLFNFLKGLGYKQKSYISHQKVLEYIPKNLRYLFLRGLIDADGCFSLQVNHGKKFSICSTYEQDWDYLKTFFENIGINTIIALNIMKLGKNSNLTFTKFKYFVLLQKFIYPNGWDGIGLKRKYDKCNDVINSCDRKWALHIDENL